MSAGTGQAPSLSLRSWAGPGMVGSGIISLGHRDVTAAQTPPAEFSSPGIAKEPLASQAGKPEVVAVSSPLKHEFTQARDQTNQVQQPAKSYCAVLL